LRYRTFTLTNECLYIVWGSSFINKFPLQSEAQVWWIFRKWNVVNFFVHGCEIERTSRSLNKFPCYQSLIIIIDWFRLVAQIIIIQATLFYYFSFLTSGLDFLQRYLFYEHSNLKAFMKIFQVFTGIFLVLPHPLLYIHGVYSSEGCVCRNSRVIIFIHVRIFVGIK
jgi:hypothetical protein